MQLLLIFTFGSERHCREILGKAQELWEMLAEGFGKNVQEGGFPIDSLGRVQLQRSRRSETPLQREGGSHTLGVGHSWLSPRG